MHFHGSLPLHRGPSRKSTLTFNRKGWGETETAPSAATNAPRRAQISPPVASAEAAGHEFPQGNDAASMVVCKRDSRDEALQQEGKES